MRRRGHAVARRLVVQVARTIEIIVISSVAQRRVEARGRNGLLLRLLRLLLSGRMAQGAMRRSLRSHLRLRHGLLLLLLLLLR